jgi:hypothetical protein
VTPRFKLGLDIDTAFDDDARLRATVFGLPLDVQSIDDDYDDVMLSVDILDLDTKKHLDLDFCNVYENIKTTGAGFNSDEDVLGADESDATGEAAALRRDLHVVAKDLRVKGVATPNILRRVARVHRLAAVLFRKIGLVHRRSDARVIREVRTAKKEYARARRACAGIR